MDALATQFCSPLVSPSIHSSTPFPSCMIAHCICRAFHHAPCIDRAVARRQMNGQRSINSSRRRATTDSARTSHGRLRLHEKPRPAPPRPSHDLVGPARAVAPKRQQAENIPSRLSLAPLSFDSSLQSPCPSMAAMSVSSPSCACVCVIEREREVLDYCFSRGLTTKASTFGDLSTPLEDGRPVSGRGRVATAWHWHGRQRRVRGQKGCLIIRTTVLPWLCLCSLAFGS